MERNQNKSRSNHQHKRNASKSGATIRDVAAHAGVAPMTVSRTLRIPELVAPATRERVRKAILELNYIPNLSAGSLSTQVSRIIAIIVPSMRHSIFAETLHVMIKRFEAQGYRSIIGCNEYSPKREEALIKTLLSHKPDGLVLTGYTHTRETVRLLGTVDLPLVEMWNLGPKPLGMMVGIDNVAAAYEMTTHLLMSGRRRLAMVVSHTRGNDRSKNRISGFRKAIMAWGLNPKQAPVIETDIEYEAGSAAIDQVLARDPDIDGIFLASDILAVGGLLRLKQRGVSVPEQVAVAGFDDAELSRLVDPTLTTVRMDRALLGQTVANLILDTLHGVPVSRKFVDVGFEIVVRESA